MEAFIQPAICIGILVAFGMRPFILAFRAKRRDKALRPQMFLGEFVPRETAADTQARERQEAWKTFLSDTARGRSVPMVSLGRKKRAGNSADRSASSAKRRGRVVDDASTVRRATRDQKTRGIVRDMRGQDQPADKRTAQR